MTEQSLDDVLADVETKADLEDLVGLTDIGRTIRRVQVHGKGGKAYVRLDLDNGDYIELDPLGSFSTPQKMNYELSAQGCKPALKSGGPQTVARLIHTLGEHYEASQHKDRAWELGAQYLREAVTVDVDMSEQGPRWQAFAYLDTKLAKAARNAVLVDSETGNRYVRTQWLVEYLRRNSDIGDALKLKAQLERAGWKRTGSEGRIKAIEPGFPTHSLQWAFLIVPPQWGEAGDRTEP
jgi:hypothetical protein